MLSPRWWVVDGAVAAGFVVVGQLAAWSVIQDSNVPLHGSSAVQSLLYLVIDSLVLLRRRAPLVALSLMLPLGILQTSLGGTTSFFAGFLAVALVLFGVASRSSLRLTVAATIYSFLGLVAIIGVSEDLHYGAELPFVAIVLGIAVALGQLMRARSLQTHSAIARADRLEEERERVLEEERARIARELHDVIAHSVSVMIVQAGAARLSLDGELTRTTESLLAVERAGRQALDEMRRLLGMLRQGTGDPQLTPQPGLGDLRALLDQVAAAGVPVELEVSGAQTPLAPGVDLTAYRVIQEALTNTIKHAGPARARLRIAYEADAVEIEVVDDGRGSGAPRNGGHGLVGMRERVELYRGALAVGSLPERGFRVRARLPTGATA